MRLKRVLLISGITLGVLVLLVAGLIFVVSRGIDVDPFTPLYADNCSVCHGQNFEGTVQGPALIGLDLNHGDSVAEISASISNAVIFNS